jgi:hypothetical protein
MDAKRRDEPSLSRTGFFNFSPGVKAKAVRLRRYGDALSFL